MRYVRFMRAAVIGLTLSAVIAACSGGAQATESALASQPDPSPAETPIPASPSKSAAPASPGDTEGDEWIEVSSFGRDDTIESVHDVVEAEFGLIAAGVELETRSLAVFDPLAGDSRVWLSADGSAWEDVTPADTFTDASINQLVVLADGAVLALGFQEGPAAWETRDGRTWGEIALTVGGAPVIEVADGGRGYLARAGVELGGQQLWHSSDGRTYVAVGDPTNGRIVTGTGAGPEGFVILAEVYESGQPARIYASGNGIDWFEATSDGWDPSGVAALGPDWIAVDSRPFDLQEDAEVQTWLSGNGLDWTEAGRIPLRAIPIGDDAVCSEHPRLVSTGSLVVASTTLSYPCSEGLVQRFGSAFETFDGATWLPLPFVASVDPTDGSTRGTRVAAGIDLESGTLLVGEKDYRATFWFRPSD